MAFLYPLLAALIALVTTGQPNVGAMPVFQDLEGWEARLARAGGFLVGLGASALMFWAAIRYAADVGLKAGKSVETLTQQPGFLSKPARWVSEQVFGLVVFAAAAAIAVFVADAVAGFVAVAVAGAFAVAVALGAGTGAIAAAVALAGFAVVLGDKDDATVIAFFFLVLPAANALADGVSVSATRKLLQVSLDHRHSAGALIAFMALDLFIGIGCLIILLAGLVGLLELWEMFATPPLDWVAYWRAAQEDRSAGIALWVMCFTTLLTTLIHAAWALSLWLFDSPDPTKIAVEEMRHWDDSAPETDQAAISLRVARQLQRGSRIRWLRFAALFAVLAALALWFEIWSLTSVAALFADSTA